MTELHDYDRPSDEPITASDESVPATQETSFGRWLIETILLVALAFALAQGIKTFVVQPFVIPTGSMIPTIEIGDRVLAEKLTYRFSGEPERGDVVVFDDPGTARPQLIKRVIAVGGEIVDIRDGVVYVNDEPLDEPYTHDRRSDPGTVELPFAVPEDHVWLMGDNRPNSGDSRFFGPRPLESVHGKAFWTYWPPGRFGPLE
jgi:signal peptidase I